MQTIIKNLKWLSLSIILGVVIGGGLIAVKAWSEPASAPPGGNIGAPINTSGIGQIKSGALQANGLRNIGTTVLDGIVGIGVITPGAKLDVAGIIQATGLKLTTGAGAGKVLTSDASGIASWQAGSSGWPAGSYCIMANGACPSGFSLKTLSKYFAEPNAVGTAAQTAGSSSYSTTVYAQVHYNMSVIGLNFCCK